MLYDAFGGRSPGIARAKRFCLAGIDALLDIKIWDQVVPPLYLFKFIKIWMH